MPMRTFRSYGPVDTELNYYAPRKELVDTAFSWLMGEDPEKNGHYITVWAPRQTGKTWVMQEVAKRIERTGKYDMAIFSMEFVKEQKSYKIILEEFVRQLSQQTGINFPVVEKWEDLPSLFTKRYFHRPVLLIIDEFDSLQNEFINRFAGIFRGIYTSRTNEPDKKSHEKTYLLHGAALIGVRSVLGVENVKGSPFNIQQSVQIPNLTFDEVDTMFKWYEKDSGQKISGEVIEQIYYECRGQPGLTCWLGELITQKYNKKKNEPISMEQWQYAYMYATQGLPNNNIMNIIEKAKREPYKNRILDLFRTDEKVEFRFDNKELNYLYMNGISDIEESREEMKLYVKFASPFIQKRLFGYFSNEIFENMGRLTAPFVNLDDTITAENLNIKNLIGMYGEYLRQNKEWLFKDVPRRSDMRIYEVVYHFNLYRYLYDLLKGWKAAVHPEFPTGNGKIDILIRHGGKLYGLELKSFTNEKGYKDALHQSAHYGIKLGLREIFLIFFIDDIDEENRKKYEANFSETDKKGTVVVKPLFVRVN